MFYSLLPIYLYIVHINPCVAGTIYTRFQGCFRSIGISLNCWILSESNTVDLVIIARVSIFANLWFWDFTRSLNEMKWNESGFRPPLCTYRLNWARRTSWGWWDDWDDTVLQTQDSKFQPWRSEAEHATSRSRRLPTILTFTRGWGRNNFISFKPPRPGTEPRTLA